MTPSGYRAAEPAAVVGFRDHSDLDRNGLAWTPAYPFTRAVEWTALDTATGSDR